MRLLLISTAATILLASFAACNDDDTSETGAGGGAATGTGTGTGTGTTPTGTTSTGTGTNDGCGGGPACEQLCEDAEAKVDACHADAGLGQGGAGGGTGVEFLCDEEGQCVSRCLLQYDCLEIVVGDQEYTDCYHCCKNPYVC